MFFWAGCFVDYKCSQLPVKCSRLELFSAIWEYFASTIDNVLSYKWFSVTAPTKCHQHFKSSLFGTLAVTPTYPPLCFRGIMRSLTVVALLDGSCSRVSFRAVSLSTYRMHIVVHLGTMNPCPSLQSVSRCFLFFYMRCRNTVSSSKYTRRRVLCPGFPQWTLSCV